MTAEGPAPRCTFNYRERLHAEREFKQILARGRRLVHPALFIYVYPRGDGRALRRLGLVTGRKVGGAVQRNRLKRRLREIFRLNKQRLSPGIDIIFMSRPGAADLNYRQLETVVFNQWRKAGILETGDK